ncbi:hypothetical protein RB614_12275 [Phytohabitans sp. ZYX-F-186]|uniref:Uncharacterized protein n=1 Tax=Phytohabitans maris TaxID=3071409 RepID=A0ABU0ZGA1_9ACTN|nr:hypothetical protein [Phytohabitans sp. ZYX-F-186]MDQ7905300.1 hypothetical protein [Phytohabitans sp. ZYX-F-186]
MSDETAPSAVVRRLGREYGWLLAAVGLGALVLVCSVPFVTGSGMSWNSGDPLAAPAKVAPQAGSAPAAVPEGSAGPPTSAAPTAPAAPSRTPARAGTTRPPAVRTTAPAPPRTTAPAAAPPRAPVALGPEGGPMGLWQMLRDYCARTHERDAEAQLRNGTGQAEDNWECRWERRGRQLIDMHGACRGRYGSVAFAQFSNRNDAFSWHCYRR